MNKLLLPIALLSLILSGCATTTTQLAPVSEEAVEREKLIQREIVLTEVTKAQQRLDDLAFDLLAAASPLCTDKLGPRFGFAYATIDQYDGVWVAAAEEALGLSTIPKISSVATHSPADAAGLREGDEIIRVNGASSSNGDAVRETLEDLVVENPGRQISLVVRRDSEEREITIVPAEVCDFRTVVMVEGDINAFADGERVILPWAMMRFADDDELRGVLAHEIAHNAMGHIDARKQNALLGGFFGALIDVAAATQGINTGGQNTSNFMAVAAQAYSQDFEREADYVGMYILARADHQLESVPMFWRHFAQINPAAISYASTHPTTAERFVRLGQAIEEIERKKAEGHALLPQMKDSD